MYEGQTRIDGIKLIDTLPKGLLTQKEENIISYIYEMDYPSAHIARLWGCTRQSVNQTKHSAIKKIKKYLQNERD